MVNKEVILFDKKVVLFKKLKRVVLDNYGDRKVQNMFPEIHKMFGEIHKIFPAMLKIFF